MTLAAAQTELKTILRRELSWTGPIVTEYEAWEKLPTLVIHTSDMAPSVIGGAIVEYEMEIKMYVMPDDVDGVAKHRDLATSGSLAKVCFDLNEEMECGTFMYGGVSIETDKIMDEKGTEWITSLAIVCDGTLYVAQEDEVPPVIVPPPPTAAGIMARTLTARPGNIQYAGGLSAALLSGTGSSEGDPLTIDSSTLSGIFTEAIRIPVEAFFDIPAGVSPIYSAIDSGTFGELSIGSSGLYIRVGNIIDNGDTDIIFRVDLYAINLSLIHI